ncbi:uncharacterized protein LOC116167553 [Photinus pyralis]|uniref:uncharacterized protein LOC116167553 n=1 Tax=Photinus pyralis TaxID=7054 RepID=UPI0012678123|nr:uncharacterized protein LOC116167553 [Photinus pyralis]
MKQFIVCFKIFMIVVKCDLLLQSHTDRLRLIAIKKKLNIAQIHQNVPVLSTELPIKTIDELELFEQEAQSTALLQLLKRSSGSNERTTIFKMLSKVFDFATICLWRGRKQNHSVENLQLIKVMPEAVRDLKDQAIEQAEIDWFRSAQQRFSRRKNV